MLKKRKKTPKKKGRPLLQKPKKARKMKIKLPLMEKRRVKVIKQLQREINLVERVRKLREREKMQKRKRKKLQKDQKMISYLQSRNKTCLAILIEIIFVICITSKKWKSIFDSIFKHQRYEEAFI